MTRPFDRDSGRLPAWLRRPHADDRWRGAADAVSELEIVLTSGLPARAPLSADAARIGVSAAMAAVIAGGPVYAVLGSPGVPVGRLSSATTLIQAGLVACFAADSPIQLGGAADSSAVVAVCSACVIFNGLWRNSP